MEASRKEPFKTLLFYDIEYEYINVRTYAFLGYIAHCKILCLISHPLYIYTIHLYRIDADSNFMANSLRHFSPFYNRAFFYLATFFIVSCPDCDVAKKTIVGKLFKNISLSILNNGSPWRVDMKREEDG